MNEAKNLNQSLFDGLTVLRKFMADLSPFTWYTLQDVQESLGPEWDYQKVNRIVKTLHAGGFVDVDNTGRRYQLSREMITLSYQYLTAVKREHERLKTDFTNFKFD